MSDEDWAKNSQVLEALRKWDDAQLALDEAKRAALPPPMGAMDPRVRDASKHVAAAWSEYEAARELAGGPKAESVS
jgi:hypothetical protein